MRTNSTTDHYCPNCRQMVRPSHRRDYSGMLISLALLVFRDLLLRAVGLDALVGHLWITALLLFVHVTFVWAVILAPRSCPRCESEALEPEAPGDARRDRVSAHR